MRRRRQQRRMGMESASVRPASEGGSLRRPPHRLARWKARASAQHQREQLGGGEEEEGRDPRVEPLFRIDRRAEAGWIKPAAGILQPLGILGSVAADPDNGMHRDRLRTHVGTNFRQHCASCYLGPL